jgi:hypothetical protein
MDETASVYLPSFRKLVFRRHRWYTGNLLFEMVKNIQVVFGKGPVKGQKRKKRQHRLTYLQETINFFMYLPYWKDLETCRSIDLMHVTKNVFDNIIETLLDMRRKMKHYSNDRTKTATDVNKLFPSVLA